MFSLLHGNDESDSEPNDPHPLSLRLFAFRRQNKVQFFCMLDFDCRVGAKHRKALPVAGRLIRYGKVTALSRKLSAAELAHGTLAVDKSTTPSHGRPHGKLSVADLQHNAAMQQAGLYSVIYYSLENCYELRKKWTYQGRSN